MEGGVFEKLVVRLETPLPDYLNYIAGKDVASADGKTFTAFNPTTGGPWGTFAVAGPHDVDRRGQGGIGRVP